MKVIYLLLAISIACAASAAWAIVIGGSNLSFGYPSPTCSKPLMKPIKPFQFDTQLDVDRYNSQVDFYNQAVRRYSECITEYLENAALDIKRIQEKAKDASMSSIVYKLVGHIPNEALQLWLSLSVSTHGKNVTARVGRIETRRMVTTSN